MKKTIIITSTVLFILSGIIEAASFPLSAITHHTCAAQPAAMILIILCTGVAGFTCAAARKEPAVNYCRIK